MIDSHTHLTSCSQPAADLIARAREAGLTRILSVGMDEDSCRRVLQLADEFDEVYAAIGRHPNVTAGYDESALQQVRRDAAHPRCVAIGESGLDKYRSTEHFDDQLRAFHDHIELARELGKPLVVHTRAADEETIGVLKSSASDLRVIIHCFSMPDRVRECVDAGWWISYAGNVTYPANADLAASITDVPADRLLVETDAPYLTPVPHRKERNRPDLVTVTARFVAEQRGLTYEELSAQVTANAKELLAW